MCFYSLYRYLHNILLHISNELLYLPKAKYLRIFWICRFANVFIVFIAHKLTVSKNTIMIAVIFPELECLINFLDAVRK